MSFKDIEIKRDYDSDEDNLVTDFYLPVLSEATTYYRRSGFYSSSSLAVSARGIAELIRKNGKMKLICNVHLSEKDYDSLKRAQENPTKFLEESNIGFDLNDIEDEIEKDHVEALGWMLANGYLEIKIAFPQNNYGIYHPKTGVFFDEEGNYFSFSGSENESFKAMIFNVEEFKTFKSWEDWGYESASKDLKKFEKEWVGDRKSTIVVDLPTAIKDKLIKHVPHEKADLGLLKKNYPSIYKNIKNQLPARDYQIEAVKNWFENNCKGIFNMATGSGKTITALNCYKTLKEEFSGNFLTLVVCPQKHLVSQWEEVINEFFTETILSTVDNTSWKNDLKKIIREVRRKEDYFPFVLSTHKKFSDPEFIKIIEKRKTNIFLIVDEVHGVGSSIFQNGLRPTYQYRLGLSATPERWFDDEGTIVIDDYFDGCVFKFTLDEAIEAGFLTRYDYWPHFVTLTDSEFDEYMELTKKIAIKYNNHKNFEDLTTTGDYIRRQAIIDHAENKYDELKKILRINDYWDHLLVYCSSKPSKDIKQIDRVQKILLEEDIIAHPFTSNESMTKRKNILDNFDRGNYQALTAMKCLDEGVDVKSAKHAILMASTSNPREHIQRRGRLLRTHPGKDKAVIDDLIVLPNSLDKLTKAERNIINKELDRYIEFMASAENFNECNKIYMEWRGIHGE